MPPFVLIHGGMHGGWCWEHMASLLKAARREVNAPDLPGHGADPTPRERVTMADYVARVVDALASVAEPAILVGHSMGGMVVTAAAAHARQRVRQLVYVSAIVPRDGESLNVASGRATMRNPTLESALVAADGGVSHHITEAGARATFFSDLDEADAAAAYARLTPEPDRPLSDPVRAPDAALDGIDRTYIFCSQDRALLPAQQHHAIGRCPAVRVATLDCGHSPFLSHPEALARLLLAL